MDSELDRYFADQNAPVRSAVFDIAYNKALKEIVERTGMKEAEVLANKKFYNAILAQAQEANDRNVFSHDAKKDRQGRWIEQSMPLNLNHFEAIKKYEGLEAYQAAVQKYWREQPARAEALRLPKPSRSAA